jgi:hypothetical protein
MQPMNYTHCWRPGWPRRFRLFVGRPTVRGLVVLVATAVTDYVTSSGKGCLFLSFRWVCRPRVIFIVMIAVRLVCLHKGHSGRPGISLSY